VRQCRTPGSVRGAPGTRCSYRDQRIWTTPHISLPGMRWHLLTTMQPRHGDRRRFPFASHVVAGPPRSISGRRDHLRKHLEGRDQVLEISPSDHVSVRGHCDRIMAVDVVVTAVLVRLLFRALRRPLENVPADIVVILYVHHPHAAAPLRHILVTNSGVGHGHRFRANAQDQDRALDDAVMEVGDRVEATLPLPALSTASTAATSMPEAPPSLFTLNVQ